jgi:hypothetical protein
MNDADRVLTWAGLLGRCAELARAAVALPEGDRWREAVAPVCTLHAVTLALESLDEVAEEERPGALDRAEILCRGAVETLTRLWDGDELPAQVRELIEESRAAFDMAANAGVEWIVESERLVCGHPGELVERLLRAGFGGELFVARPGVSMFRGAVAAFARSPGGGVPTGEQARLIEGFLEREGKVREAERIGMARQVYRQMDFATGKVVRDVVVPMNEPPVPGQALLVLAIDRGEAVGVPLPMGRGRELEAVPVVEMRAGED